MISLGIRVGDDLTVELSRFNENRKSSSLQSKKGEGNGPF
jgi:hypothetical protein